MDSLPKRLPRWKDVVYFCDFDENSSVFEKALRFAEQTGSSDIYVAGALGWRPDHALVNLSLAERWSKKMKITLLDRGLARLAGPGNYEFRCRRGQPFSLISYPPWAVVSTEGL